MLVTPHILTLQSKPPPSVRCPPPPTERVISEKRAATDFGVKCDTGRIDAYVTSQLSGSGRVAHHFHVSCPLSATKSKASSWYQVGVILAILVVCMTGTACCC